MSCLNPPPERERRLVVEGEPWMAWAAPPGTQFAAFGIPAVDRLSDLVAKPTTCANVGARI